MVYRKYIRLLTVILGIVFFPLVSLASDLTTCTFTASGFGNNAYNGDYTHALASNANDNHGLPQLSNGSKYAFSTLIGGSYYWVIDASYVPDQTSNDYYTTLGASIPSPDPVPSDYTWSVSLGTPSAGSFTKNCGATTTTATSSATSTEAYLASLNFGMGILIVLGFLMVGGFMYNNFTEK